MTCAVRHADRRPCTRSPSDTAAALPRLDSRTAGAPGGAWVCSWRRTTLAHHCPRSNLTGSQDPSGCCGASQPDGPAYLRSCCEEPQARAVRLHTSLLQRANDLDVRLYSAIAGTTTPWLDEPTQRRSTAANDSRLSMASAAVLALVGGARGHHAAVTGLAGVAVTSATVNLGTKMLTRRPRPDRATLGVVQLRHVPMRPPHRSRRATPPQP